MLSLTVLQIHYLKGIHHLLFDILSLQQFWNDLQNPELKLAVVASDSLT